MRKLPAPDITCPRSAERRAIEDWLYREGNNSVAEVGAVLCSYAGY